MLIFKFTKTSTAALVSHVDTLRSITYLFRRAGLVVEYSKGFNPHMELGFSSPIPLGVESMAEYVSVKTPETADMLARLNAASPNGITFLRQWNTDVNPAALFNRATYMLSARGIGSAVADVLAENYSITYMERGIEVTKVVSDKIFDAATLDGNTALVTLSIGNNNLRPDRLVLNLMKTHGLSGDYHITKVAAYVDEVDADDFLSQRCEK